MSGYDILQIALADIPSRLKGFLQLICGRQPYYQNFMPARLHSLHRSFGCGTCRVLITQREPQPVVSAFLNRQGTHHNLSRAWPHMTQSYGSVRRSSSYDTSINMARSEAGLLVLCLAVFAVLAEGRNDTVNIAAINTAMVTSLHSMNANSLSLTEPMVPPVNSCELTVQIQSGDTCKSVG